MRDFEELCIDNYGRVYKYIFALTGSREASEDLIQDVFTAAFLKGAGFLQHENPTAFLYKTARNMTLTYLKKQQRARVEFLDENVADGDGDLCDVILRECDRQLDETIYAEQVVGGLDRKQRALYEARYIEKKPIKEIAQNEGIEEPAMRMRLVRLRRDITKSVDDLKLDER